MSPKLKRLSGPEVIAVFREMGLQVERQRGSHVKLARLSASGERQILTVPIHKELDLGALRAIIRQATRFVSDDELRVAFYSP